MDHRPIEKRRHRAEVFRFALIGALGFATNASGVLVLQAGVGPIIAQLIAFPVAATVTWWCNRMFTFSHSGKSWQLEWVHYLGANLVGWLVTNGIYITLIVSTAFFRENVLYALAIGAGFGMILNFAAAKWIVFRSA